MSKGENPDFPPGVWKIQKAGSNRLMECGTRMRECHRGRWSVCHPAGEQMRTNYILPLKFHEAKRNESHSVVSNSLWPPYTVHRIIQARILEWVVFQFSRASSQPRDWTKVSHIAGGFFTGEEFTREAKNTGVGSLSLLQWIFPT